MWVASWRSSPAGSDLAAHRGVLLGVGRVLVLGDDLIATAAPSPVRAPCTVPARARSDRSATVLSANGSNGRTGGALANLSPTEKRVSGLVGAALVGLVGQFLHSPCRDLAGTLARAARSA